MEFPPSLVSVVIVAYNARETIGDCLRALEEQTVQGFETIVVDSSADDTADVVRREFPAVRLIRSERRLYPGDARNAGIAAARGSLIAFVDSDCVAAPDWVARIAEAHRGESLIVGGSVGVANPESVAGWASYFCEFTGWIQRGAPRRAAEIPTCCLSFKRDAFDRFGPFLEGSYCSDTLFTWKATEAGHTPLFDPSIHVRHRNPAKLAPILVKQRMHGETFASVRARHWRWSRLHSMARAVSWPLLPVWLWTRAAARVMPKRDYRFHFLRATPALLAVLVSWSWGEARGYWSAR